MLIYKEVLIYEEPQEHTAGRPQLAQPLEALFLKLQNQRGGVRLLIYSFSKYASITGSISAGRVPAFVIVLYTVS